ncbi:putative immunoglobulin-blocking virulence protein [Mycoplasma sp. OR1901]|uniref:putative immunoglobulin-blocking virulence protein n=1 Tax=Mycoplasma sp. OR1901 TaxID=2742195 RepID=UPI001582F05F|nr:putative immunoglobulin-blocking virulence protein [Mycoplasma sp. OR1901]QKT05237.1 putative immunoglobulin-blocking virulence protein [Mycoplasma sp. OR1901]
MKIKTRKFKLNLLIIGLSISASSFLATLIYNSNTYIKSGSSLEYKVDSPKLINQENLDFSKSQNTNVDNNLKPVFEKKIVEPPKIEKIKKKIIIETPKIEPINKPKEKIVVPKVIKEVEKPKPKPNEIEKKVEPQPKPIEKVAEIIQPEIVDDETKTLLDSDGTGALNYKNYRNLKVKATIPPDRVYDQEDIDKGIVNPDRYVADILPNVTSVQVTEKLKQTAAYNAKRALQSRGKEAWSGFIVSSDWTDTDKHLRIRNHEDFWFNWWFRFHRLLRNGDKIKEFLTEEGQKLYPELRKIPGVYKHNNGILTFSDLAILNYIDYDKFTKPSANTVHNLSKGLFIDPDERNIFVNENGELDSAAYSPLYNKVVAELTRNNSEKRVFGNNSYESRSPESIANGEYKGWTRYDRTSYYNEKFKLGLTNTDGIRIDDIDRDVPDQTGKLNSGIAVEIDASNDEGYKKAKEIILKLKEQNAQITAYRFKNIGKNNSSQKFREIFRELPEELPLLELFLESFNTSAVSELRNKRIKELGFYTTLNSLAEEWNINPWALKNVSYVNTADYNVSFDFGKNVKVVTRLTFDTLSFDKEDLSYNPDGSLNVSKINDGLRMAYWVRNNEKIFQGSSGPGLHPDHNESGNGYPQGLDFSRVEEVKSLQNLVFSNSKNKKATPRMLRRIVFFNNKPYYQINLEQLNEAQFNTVLDKQVFPGVPPSKIIYSNGKETKFIRIVSTDKTKLLTSEGVQNLNTMIDYSDKTFDRNNVIIEVLKDDIELQKEIQKYGFKYKVVNGNEEDLQFS